MNRIDLAPCVVPAGLRYSRGGDDAGWLRPLVAYDGPDRLVADFLRAVRRVAGDLALPWQVGTWFVARSYTATTAGQWHRDSGGGVRFVAVAGSGAAQDFRDPRLDALPGDVVVYTKEEHRRPCTGPGLRAFLSATLYAPGEVPDLTCPRLAPLRGAS